MMKMTMKKQQSDLLGLFIFSENSYNSHISQTSRKLKLFTTYTWILCIYEITYDV